MVLASSWVERSCVFVDVGFELCVDTYSLQITRRSLYFCQSPLLSIHTAASLKLLLSVPLFYVFELACFDSLGYKASIFQQALTHNPGS